MVFKLHLSSALFAFAAVTLLSASASAQLDGGEITYELKLPEGDRFIQKSAQDELEFFNLKNCVCDTAFQIELLLENAGPAITPNEVEVWVGDSCNDIQLQPENCIERTDLTIANVQTLTSLHAMTFSVRDFVEPGASPGGPCEQKTETESLWLLIDEGNDGTYEYTASIEIPTDTKPPSIAAELNPVARGAESAIQVSWDSDVDRSEVDNFQLLCARVDGMALGEGFPTDDPEYQSSLWPVDIGGCSMPDGTAILSTGRGRIGGTVDAGPEPDAGPGPDAGPPLMLPGGLEYLNPEQICASTSATSNSLRAEALENGVDYQLVVVVADEAQNAAAISLGTASPSPAIDFWEDYKDNGGLAEGEFCFVATATFGDYDHPYVLVLRDFRDDTLAHFAAGRAFIRWYYRNSPGVAGYIGEHSWARATSYVLLFPVVVGAGLWEYTTALGKLGLFAALFLFFYRRRLRRPSAASSRRRTRRLAAAAATAALLISTASLASAETYWDEINQDVMAVKAPEHVKWNFEIKFGPYVPDVDSEFSGTGVGPFERMFYDGPFLMTQLVLERFFLWPEGQLGVSGSLGFLGTSAPALLQDDMGNYILNSSGDPTRSDADETSFRLMPTSLSAVYRLTALDDRYRIPVVPYGKLGLAYYIWWITDPSGSIAEAPTAECPDAGMAGSDCSGSRARGGSLGWQGSLGIALRAERLDRSAELSLKNELGIYHAGFFAELTYASVDGFGSDKRLAVGDFTWFGGVNFEF